MRLTPHASCVLRSKTLGSEQNLARIRMAESQNGKEWRSSCDSEGLKSRSKVHVMHREEGGGEYRRKGIAQSFLRISTASPAHTGYRNLGNASGSSHTLPLKVCDGTCISPSSPVQEINLSRITHPTRPWYLGVKYRRIERGMVPGEGYIIYRSIGDTRLQWGLVSAL